VLLRIDGQQVFHHLDRIGERIDLVLRCQGAADIRRAIIEHDNQPVVPCTGLAITLQPAELPHPQGGVLRQPLPVMLRLRSQVLELLRKPFLQHLFRVAGSDGLGQRGAELLRDVRAVSFADPEEVLSGDDGLDPLLT